ncbi:MAG: hypothetical protein COY66_02960 [Candidatus Kerfeldbacteria bacterium CG_4_10_14_0_8_um_filter_42_10]|uniref:PEGA domain-containing protein n=1 Tax=Candidatus Kerfeldbacteria bacterium CG_4_10_14_0_8_um_filter_42_10 TaxID=2014248 RepID=A0A2M7RJ39_9BACT|nr:MAG: hypothetical protein COY66_02960 [Candidatus Kerfeldbacteria bacterium CG_4_10_14_0_8_um_filter_42_10]
MKITVLRLIAAILLITATSSCNKNPENPIDEPVIPGFGNLVIQSQPLGAQIWITDWLSDSLAGITPDTLFNLASGACDLRLTMPGYLPIDFTAVVVGDDTTLVNISMENAPPYKIFYIKGDSMFTMAMDSLYPVVFDTGGYTSSWALTTQIYSSPDNSMLAYSNQGGIGMVIRNVSGSLVSSFQYGSRANSFNWSHEGNKVVNGVYYDGLYVYDLATNQSTKIYDTPGQTYDHCPSYSPDDSKIAFVNHSYGGYNSWVRMINSNGSNAQSLIWHSVTGQTIYDEELDITWVAANKVLYKIYYLGIFQVTINPGDTTEQPVGPEYAMYLRVSPDQQHYAFYRSYQTTEWGLYLGDIQNWQATLLVQRPVKGIAWSPNSDAIAFTNDDGIWWCKLDGTLYHLVKWPLPHPYYFGSFSICVVP